MIHISMNILTSVGVNVTIFADMLQSLIYTLGVLPGFDSVTILDLVDIFGKCPASELSMTADSQFWDFRAKHITSFTLQGFKQTFDIVLTNPKSMEAFFIISNIKWDILW